MLKERGLFIQGSESAQIHPSIYLPGDLIVHKHRVGAFSGNALQMILRSRGMENLVLFGISTSGIVLSTVRMASDLDFKVRGYKRCLYRCRCGSASRVDGEGFRQPSHRDDRPGISIPVGRRLTRNRDDVVEGPDQFFLERACRPYRPRGFWGANNLGLRSSDSLCPGYQITGFQP